MIDADAACKARKSTIMTRSFTPKKVVILGGGVAGMSAAHELIERGFDVSVYERWSIPGGKARSIPVPNSATEGRRPLPGEHGFRFFPRFYRHLPDTMKRIPYGYNKEGVADNLVETTRMLTAQFCEAPISMPSLFPRSLDDARAELNGLMQLDLGLAPEESDFLIHRLWQVATSCAERRIAEYEKIPWWTYIDAENRSQRYREIANMVRMLVAADPKKVDVRTIGDIAMQMIFDLALPGPGADRVLNGPTNEVWIDPWLAYLEDSGVDYHLNTSVEAIHCSRGRIQSIAIKQGDRETEVRGDYYLAAVPVEAMARLLRPDVVTQGHRHWYQNVLAADPSLAGILELSRNVRWMNGIQYYLRRDIDIVHGHIAFIDTPWALSAIVQGQFWRRHDLSMYGDGTVREILSVDISDWDTPGLLYEKPASECDRDELIQDVWAQMRVCLNSWGETILRDFHADVGEVFLDPDITLEQRANPHLYADLEPLLVNNVNSWHLRPGAFTRIPNLFMAGDYVRTNTQLATMEAANESARRAVNCIIEASGLGKPDCRIWPLNEPEVLAPWRTYDMWRFQRGLPWHAAVPQAIEWSQQALLRLADRSRGVVKAARRSPLGGRFMRGF